LYGLRVAYHPRDESPQLVGNQKFISAGAVQTGCLGREAATTLKKKFTQPAKQNFQSDHRSARYHPAVRLRISGQPRKKKIRV
jgi:hypothetical protein